MRERLWETSGLESAGGQYCFGSWERGVRADGKGCGIVGDGWSEGDEDVCYALGVSSPTKADQGKRAWRESSGAARRRRAAGTLADIMESVCMLSGYVLQRDGYVWGLGVGLQRGREPAERGVEEEEEERSERAAVEGSSGTARWPGWAAGGEAAEQC
jgi:hypothetical protein